MERELTTFVIRSTNLDEYARGFISAIMYYFCGQPETTFRWIREEDGDDGEIWIKDLDCTTEQGLVIYNEIEKHYPGVIIALV